MAKIQTETRYFQQPAKAYVLPETGDKNISVTYTAVGIALSQWGKFENAIGELFECLVTFGQQTQAGRRAFESVHSFEGRQSMLRAAGEVYFSLHPDSNVNDIFKDLLRIGKLYSGIRNEIAHGVVSQFYLNIAGTQHISSGFFLLPNSVSSTKVRIDETPEYIYTSVEIQKFSLQFGRLIQKPFAVCQHIIAHAAALQTIAKSSTTETSLTGIVKAIPEIPMSN